MSSKYLQDISSRRLQDMSSRCLRDMSLRCFQGMSSRRLEDVFGVTNFCLPRRIQDVLQDVFKTSERRIGRRKIVRLKTCWRRLQDMSWRGLQHVFKTNKCFLVCNALLIQFTVETNWGRSATWLVHHDLFHLITVIYGKGLKVKKPIQNVYVDLMIYGRSTVY